MNIPTQREYYIEDFRIVVTLSGNKPDGKNNFIKELEKLMRKYELVDIRSYGQLPTKEELKEIKKNFRPPLKAVKANGSTV